MSRKDAPKITANPNKENFTCVTFKPDLVKLNMQRLDNDCVALFTKRVYDMAGVSDKRVKVYLNEKHIDVKDFQQYVDLYLKNEQAKELPKITAPSSDRWEVVCSLSEGSFQ